MHLSREDERVLRTCGVSRAAFESERNREEAAAAGAGADPDGLTAADLRVMRSDGDLSGGFFGSRRAETRS